MRNRIIPYRSELRAFAKDLRNNPTPQEIKLWTQIRRKQINGVEFHRQVPIDAFIVDFYCHELGLAIEVDGRIHDFQILEDMIRQSRLEEFGITFIRFTNDDVEDKMEKVINRISILVKELQTKM